MTGLRDDLKTAFDQIKSENFKGQAFAATAIAACAVGGAMYLTGNPNAGQAIKSGSLVS